MRAERARLVELQVEHDFDGAYVFAVRRFYQNVDDQLVTLFRCRLLARRSRWATITSRTSARSMRRDGRSG